MKSLSFFGFLSSILTNAVKMFLFFLYTSFPFLPVRMLAEYLGLIPVVVAPEDVRKAKYLKTIIPQATRIGATSMRTSNATGHTTQVSQLKVQYFCGKDEHSMDLIVKGTSMSVFFRLMTMHIAIFSDEPKFYSHVMKIQQALAANKTKVPIASAWEYLLANIPKIHLSNSSPLFGNFVMVLEDLKARGYTVQDDAKQLSLPEAKMIIEKLGVIHGRFLHQEDTIRTLIPPIYEGIHSGFVDPMLCRVMTGTMDKKRHLIFQGEPELLKYAESFFQPSNFDKFTDTAASTAHKTLTHNDFRLDNLFGKTSQSGELEDVILLDWQLATIGNPMLDLTYFITCTLDASATPEQQMEYQEAILKHHHAVMSRENLSKREYPWEEYRRDFDKYLPTVLFTLMMLHNTDGDRDTSTLVPAYTKRCLAFLKINKAHQVAF